VSAFNVTVRAASRRLSDVVVLGPIAHAARDANEVVEEPRTGNHEAACGPAELARGGPGQLSTRGAAGQAGVRAAGRGLVPGPRDQIAQGHSGSAGLVHEFLDHAAGTLVLGVLDQAAGPTVVWSSIVRVDQGALVQRSVQVRWTSGPTWSEAADRFGPDGIEAGSSGVEPLTLVEGRLSPWRWVLRGWSGRPGPTARLGPGGAGPTGLLAWFAPDQVAVWSGPTEAVVREGGHGPVDSGPGGRGPAASFGPPDSGPADGGPGRVVQWTVVRETVVQPRVWSVGPWSRTGWSRMRGPRWGGPAGGGSGGSGSSRQWSSVAVARRRGRSLGDRGHGEASRSLAAHSEEQRG
jgi:hypothetical protein